MNQSTEREENLFLVKLSLFMAISSVIAGILLFSYANFSLKWVIILSVVSLLFGVSFVLYMFKYFPQKVIEHSSIEPGKKKVISGFRNYWIKNYFKTKIIMFPIFISFILILLKVPYGGLLMGLSMVYFGALYTYNSYHDTDFYKYAPLYAAPQVVILSSGEKIYHTFRKMSVFLGVILIFSGVLLVTADLIYGPIIVDIFKRGLG